ncbi:hypothetical protein ACIBEA_38885 [Streptomyces sp. NPDC051555]|uniref:hypothetical protein n=1 Tax=Streptomyces sp. NPDC051555 TaxID=3365657 RepID=UPI0037A163E9
MNTANSTTAQAVGDIRQSLDTQLAPFAATMGWAEQEIEAAQHRHQESGQGAIWRAFPLLRPTHNRFHTSERLYRAHAAELLDRLAEGKNPRSATAAEMMAVLMESSLPAPLNSGAAHLYMRLFSQAFPEYFGQHIASPTDLAAYERVHGVEADEYESDLRRKLTQAWRTPGA